MKTKEERDAIQQCAGRCALCGSSVGLLLAVIASSLITSRLLSDHAEGKLEIYTHKNDSYCQIIDTPQSWCFKAGGEMSLAIMRNITIVGPSYQIFEGQADADLCSVPEGKTPKEIEMFWVVSDTMHADPQVFFPVAITQYCISTLVVLPMKMFFLSLHRTIEGGGLDWLNRSAFFESYRSGSDDGRKFTRWLGWLANIVVSLLWVFSHLLLLPFTTMREINGGKGCGLISLAFDHASWVLIVQMWLPLLCCTGCCGCCLMWDSNSDSAMMREERIAKKGCVCSGLCVTCCSIFCGIGQAVMVLYNSVTRYGLGFIFGFSLDMAFTLNYSVEVLGFVTILNIGSSCLCCCNCFLAFLASCPEKADRFYERYERSPQPSAMVIGGPVMVVGRV
eukprot:TRINITY_DN59155_c0_g1_i1.p1 TRINITY_DN59155_c0_g1~~TRINITY_DN59155_c0_g1_i1.p1  ORF type:complete len:401 (+),score=21.59 TRINITY_DN59155_c0_g1_i1:30-1205(+)